MILRGFLLLLTMALPVSAYAVMIDIPGEDGGGLTADVSATFTFDDTCMTTSCTLTVELTYSGVSGGSLSAKGQVLTGLIFEPVFDVVATSKDVFGTDVGGSANTGSPSNSGDLGGSQFVGPNSADAATDLGTDISPHWAFHPNLAFGIDNDLGSMLISSVGDITFGGQTATIGMSQLMADPDGTLGLRSGVEPNPPNGIDFGIVPTGVCDATSCPGPIQNMAAGEADGRALISDSATFTLFYNGETAKLTGIEQYHFLFGTDGNVPEPGTWALMALGLGGLAWRARRH